MPPVHTPTPVLPRSRTAITLGDTPQTRLEPTTSDRGSLLDETARVPADLLEMESGPAETDPDRLVPLRPELPVLQVALYEEIAQLTNAKNAIAAAGHVVDTAATGRDGKQRVIDAIRNRTLDAVIVALPGGEPIIEAALALEPRRPILIAALAGSAVDAVTSAHDAGADLAVTRPHDVERLAPILLAAARLHATKHSGFASRNSDRIIRTRMEAPAEPEPRTLLSFEMFQRVVEAEIPRAHKVGSPLSLALFAVDVSPPPPPGVGGILRARAGNALLNAVRDIDTAAQLDKDRFLVLFPYTDPGSAAGLARRVTAAVAALDPVVAGGRSFPPRVVGGIAGALLGQQLSFEKLMKDATRALEQARREGVEIAVQR